MFLRLEACSLYRARNLTRGVKGCRVRLLSVGVLGFVYFPMCLAFEQDVNNDGFNDIILGDPPADSSTTGAAYVVYGSESFSFSRLDVSDLDGTNGFKIEGTDEGENSGTSVAGAGVSDGSTGIIVSAGIYSASVRISFS